MASSESKDGGCLVVYTRCHPGRDDEFNKWYDEVHIPELCALGPFTGATRYRIPGDAQMMDQTHQYLAVYQFKGSAEEARRAMEESADKLEMTDAFDAATAFMTIAEVI